MPLHRSNEEKANTNQIQWFFFPRVQNQHEDLKKQYYELHNQHQAQGKDHDRLLDEHREHFEKLQQVKEREISQLKGARLSHTHTHTLTHTNTQQPQALKRRKKKFLYSRVKHCLHLLT